VSMTCTYREIWGHEVLLSYTSGIYFICAYTAATIKDEIQFQKKMYSYNNFILRQNEVRVFVGLFARACVQRVRACVHA
jgi:hypothetical protein